MKNNHLRNIRFGLLLGYPALERWQHEVIRNLLEGGAQFVVLAHCTGDDKPKENLYNRLKSFQWHQLIFKLWHKYVYKPAAKELNTIDEMLAQTTLTIKVKNTSHYVSFSDHDIDKLKEFRCDFFLQFWMGIIQGEVLNIASHGIWSFHHGDEEYYRGTPPGFWEIYNKEPITGAILQQLTDKLDKGIILKKGYFPTVAHSWNHQTENLLMQTIRWPAQCAFDLINGTLEKKESHSKARIYKPPKNLVFILFICKLVINRIAFHLHNIFKAEDWNIGIYMGSKPVKPADEVRLLNKHREEDDNNKLDRKWNSEKELTWFLKVSKDRFVADPFLFEVDDIWWLFFEDFSYKSGKGVISAIKLGEVGSFPYEVKKVLELPHHLSYPFLFGYEGKIWCLPECHAAHKLQLFELDRTTFQMIPGPVLIEGRDLVDPTLWHDGQRWWLFAGEKPYQSNNLFIWYSDNPFGPWHEHSANPVKQDIRSSRPAGNLYVENGKLIRPTQDCSNHYGRRVNLNHITELTLLKFKEEPYGVIEPDKQWLFNKGLHTWQYFEQFTVIDAKRFSYIPSAAKMAFYKLIRRKMKVDYD